MGLTLYILRHAQSADKQFGQSDADRELTPIGRHDSERVGFFFKQQYDLPQLVLCSNAIRTRQTCALVLNAMSEIPTSKVDLRSELYHGTVETYLDIIQLTNSTINTLLVIGHNPAVTELAQFLCEENIGVLSPSGMVGLQFPFDQWRDLRAKSGRLFSQTDPSISGSQK